jgi:hypothetical protein
MNDDELRIEAHVDAINRVKRNVEDKLLKIPGVNAVGIGPKFKGGKATREWAIAVLLDRKKSLSEIPPGEVVPDEIEGFKTDVTECGPITVVGGPIRGGMNLETDGGGHGGTLGCVLEEPSTSGGHSNFYALTNQHVLLPGSSIAIPSPLPLVGPNICRVSCSKCCNEVIGRVFAARLTLFADAAIAFLDNGIKYLAEVSEVGTIKGKETILDSQIQGKGGELIYSVVKYGQATKLTKGKVLHLDVSGPSFLPGPARIFHRNMKDQIHILPDHGNFAEFGDSGAVVLNAASRKVVALLFASGRAVGEQGSGSGFASPIDFVLDAFKPEFNLSVVTADAPGKVHTVPAVAVEGLTRDASVPSFEGSVQAVNTVEHQLLLRAQEEILQTEAGQRYAQIVMRHQSEVRSLIDTNRRVATAWHRNDGPTIVQKMIRAVEMREVPIPSLIKDQLVADCIEKILNVLSKYGSKELRSSIEIVKPAFKRLGGMTYGQWLGQLALSDFPDSNDASALLKQS